MFCVAFVASLVIVVARFVVAFVGADFNCCRRSIAQILIGFCLYAMLEDFSLKMLTPTSAATSTSMRLSFEFCVAGCKN